MKYDGGREIGWKVGEPWDVRVVLSASGEIISSHFEKTEKLNKAANLHFHCIYHFSIANCLSDSLSLKNYLKTYPSVRQR